MDIKIYFKGTSISNSFADVKSFRTWKGKLVIIYSLFGKEQRATYDFDDIEKIVGDFSWLK